METPYTTHLSEADFEHVYEPAEDSFLLLDAIEAELPALRLLRPLVVAEIGPGSGVIVSAVARALGGGGGGVQCLAVDVNRHACRCTRETARRHGCGDAVHVVRGDLLTAVRPNSVDVVLFNPPYVVTPDDECADGGGGGGSGGGRALMPSAGPVNGLIAHAWAGGRDGRLVIDRFVRQLDGWLTPVGRAYLVLIKENDPTGVARELEERGFAGAVIAERRIRGEHLFVMRIVRAARAENAM